MLLIKPFLWPLTFNQPGLTELVKDMSMSNWWQNSKKFYPFNNINT